MIVYELCKFLIVYMFTVRPVLSYTEDYKKVIFANIDLGKDPDDGGIRIESVTVPNGAVDWDDFDNGGKRAWEELEKFRPTLPPVLSPREAEPFYQSRIFITFMVILVWILFYALALCLCPDRMRKARVVYIRFRDPVSGTTSAPSPV